MRGHFERDGKTLGASWANHLQRSTGRKVQEVQRSSGDANEFDVTHDHQLFGDRRTANQSELPAESSFVHCSAGGQSFVLAVLGKTHTERFGVSESTSHHQWILHTDSVIGEKSNP